MHPGLGNMHLKCKIENVLCDTTFNRDIYVGFCQYNGEEEESLTYT